MDQQEVIRLLDAVRQGDTLKIRELALYFPQSLRRYLIKSGLLTE